MSGLQYVTKDTLEQMKEDLQRMKAVDRPAASRAIAEAREKGDLKENAEYDAAKEAQGDLAALVAISGNLVNVSLYRDITATAKLDPSRWSATLDPPRRTATLDRRRWEARL